MALIKNNLTLSRMRRDQAGVKLPNPFEKRFKSEKTSGHRVEVNCEKRQSVRNLLQTVKLLLIYTVYINTYIFVISSHPNPCWVTTCTDSLPANQKAVQYGAASVSEICIFYIVYQN